MFLAQASMIKDALRCLEHLSLYCQGDDANVLDAKDYVSIAMEKLLAMKELDGKSLGKFRQCFKSNLGFKGVTVTQCPSVEENLGHCAVSSSRPCTII